MCDLQKHLDVINGMKKEWEEVLSNPTGYTHDHYNELDQKWEDYLDSEKGSVDEDPEWDKAMDDLGATMAKVFPYFKNNHLRR